MTSMLHLRAGLAVLTRTTLSQSRRAAVATGRTARPATAHTASIRCTQGVRSASTGKRMSNQAERAIRLKTQERARKKREKVTAADSEGGQLESEPADASTKGKAARQVPLKIYTSRTTSPAAPGVKQSKYQQDPRKLERPSKGSRLQRDKEGRLRVVRSETRAISDSHFKVANQLEHLIANHDITPLEAFERAQELVESTPTIMRREPRIYNLYVRHALRAGKRRRAFRIIDEMKKNGCAVTGQTYIAVFSNMRLQKLDPAGDMLNFKRTHSLYQGMLKNWRAAQELPQAVKENDEEKHATRPVFKPFERRVSVEEDGRGYKWYDPRFLTGRAYEKSVRQAHEELVSDQDLFVRACDEYMCLLLKHDDVDKATEMLQESESLVQLSRSRRADIASLPRVLASRVVEKFKEEDGDADGKKDDASLPFAGVVQRQELLDMAVATIEHHRASLRSIGNDEVDTFRSTSRTRGGGRTKKRATSLEHRQRTIVSDRIDDDGPPGFNPYSE